MFLLAIGCIPFGHICAQENSIELPKGPIYVLDGEEVKRSAIGDMDPNEVAKIVVLKGKSAGIFGGQRGSKKGVVLIVTKQSATTIFHNKLSLFSESYAQRIKENPDYNKILYIVDGEIYDDAPVRFYELNANEIRSIEMLDQNTTYERYGVRKEGGAAVITTQSRFID